jgi:hypothetical protein
MPVPAGCVAVQACPTLDGLPAVAAGLATPHAPPQGVGLPRTPAAAMGLIIVVRHKRRTASGTWPRLPRDAGSIEIPMLAQHSARLANNATRRRQRRLADLAGLRGGAFGLELVPQGLKRRMHHDEETSWLKDLSYALPAISPTERSVSSTGACFNQTPYPPFEAVAELRPRRWTGGLSAC